MVTNGIDTRILPKAELQRKTRNWENYGFYMFGSILEEVSSSSKSITLELKGGSDCVLEPALRMGNSAADFLQTVNRPTCEAGSD